MPARHSSRAYARVGLLGNPSDAYHGTCISVAIKNYHATVELSPLPGSEVVLEPNPVSDGTCYSSLAYLTTVLSSHGFYGGLRLLQATCKRFYGYCEDHRISLPSWGFRLMYSTTIPRSIGLSGSSAIVCAALDCLIQYYEVADRVPVQDRPALVLSAEEDLGITAGLQDRVIQVYGGAVYMDFDSLYMAQHGYGRYERIPLEKLPPLWLVHADNPSDSGVVHSTVRQRWRDGDASVVAGMGRIARCAKQGRGALATGAHDELARLMDFNFDVRLELFGDAVLGAANLEMVATARSVGAAAKFCGSGGALVCFCPEGVEQDDHLQRACRAKGYHIERIEPAPFLHDGLP